MHCNRYTHTLTDTHNIHTHTHTHTNIYNYVIYRCLLCSDDVAADLFILHRVVLGTGDCESYKYFLYGPLLLFNGGVPSKSILVSASWLAFQNFEQ